MPEVRLTCRHFGKHRSYFYRRKKRYNKTCLSSLENKSTNPKKRREPPYSRALVAKVRQIRKADPTYSAKKIRPTLLREMEAAFAPGQVIEFDMKHIYLLGQKQYAFCAVDLFDSEALIHVASSPSSLNAKAALKKVAARFGTEIKIVNDNGSENMAKAEEYLSSLNITQYWARPHRPKDKPFVEWLIGTLQRECLDYNHAPMNCAELAAVVDTWLYKYHFYRPHQSLDFLTTA